jgi:hypothetical protein
VDNITTGVRERSEWSRGASDIEGKATRVGASECGQRTSFNRTREAGNRDEVEGVVANTLNLFRNGAVGFIDWLDGQRPRAETGISVSFSTGPPKDKEKMANICSAGA